MRIFSTQALTTAMASTASQRIAAALMDNSLTVEAKTINVIGFRGFSNFLLLEGGDYKKKEKQIMKLCSVSGRLLYPEDMGLRVTCFNGGLGSPGIMVGLNDLLRPFPTWLIL